MSTAAFMSSRMRSCIAVLAARSAREDGIVGSARISSGCEYVCPPTVKRTAYRPGKASGPWRSGP